MKSNIANILKRLTVPFGAAADQPRVVIATDDPTMLRISRDAGIAYYYGDGKAFAQTITRESSTESGSLELINGSAGRAPSRYLIVSAHDTDRTRDFLELHCDSNSGVALNRSSARLHAQGESLDGPALVLSAAGVVALDNASMIVRDGRRVYMVTDFEQRDASGDLTLGVVDADVPGATATVSSSRPNARFVARGHFDFDVAVAGIGTAIGTLFTSHGGVLSGQALYVPGGTGRDGADQEWWGTLPVAGDYTFTLRARKTDPVGTVFARQTHTRISVEISE